MRGFLQGGALDLWQVDVSKRVAYSGNPSGYYYWTSTYYMDRDAYISIDQMAGRVNVLEELITTTKCERQIMHFKNPPGRGNVVATRGPFDDNFGLIADDGNHSLFVISRWLLRSASGRLSWRLNRAPLRYIDFDGDFLTSTGLVRQQAGINLLVSQARWFNSYGELITSGSVTGRVGYWQLRDGTKRRRRDPLAP